MEHVNPAFGTRRGQIGQEPDHVRVIEMGLRGQDGNASKGTTLGKVEVALKVEGGLDFGAPVDKTIGP
jgi:hypothetical protein